MLYRWHVTGLQFSVQSPSLRNFRDPVSTGTYYPSSNVLWCAPDRRELSCWCLQPFHLNLLVVRIDLAKASAVSTHVRVEKGLLLCSVRATLHEPVFEREDRGGLALLPYSKMIPASRFYVNRIFAVLFYLKTGPFMISGFVKMENICAFLMGLFFFLHPQSIYMSLPMILNQSLAVTLNGYRPCGTKN